MRPALGLLVALFLASPVAAIFETPGGPRVGSDNCPATASLSCVNFQSADSGTTASANNTVGQLSGGCPGLVSVPGPDVVYKVHIGNPDITVPSFRVVPSAGYDVALYLLSSTGPGCPSGVGNSVTNCVAATNSGGPGVTETIPPDFTLPSGDYYLFVDSPAASGSASSGTYQVFLNKFCPVELIEYSVD